jgi:ClpP class serine protease
MNREEILEIANETGVQAERQYNIVDFASRIAEAERKEMQAKIETLYAMYEVVVKQRDYLMDQQSAQVAAMRGRVQ